MSSAVESNPWLAVRPQGDRVAQARALSDLHEAFHQGRDVAGSVRAVVTQSWRRAETAGLDAEGGRAPIVMDDRETTERWGRHPLHPVLPMLRDLLSSATNESAHMLVIADADGVLMWLEGHRPVMDATSDLHLVCGADWSEGGAGTNALGTAIAVDHPVQIFSAEHFHRAVHPWQCSGAPIHDPATGAILGVVDLTGHLRTAHPHTLALVTAAAGMAEAYLRHDLLRRDEAAREAYLARTDGTAQRSALVRADGEVLLALPHGWVPRRVGAPGAGGELALPDGRVADVEPLPGHDAFVLWSRAPAGAPRAARGEADGSGARTAASVRAAGTADPTDGVDAGAGGTALLGGGLALRLFGRRPSARLPDGRTVALSRRHAEILAVLAGAGRGMTAEELTLEVYGEAGKPVTLRAEMTRLRRALGPVLGGRPYALSVPVTSDLAEATTLVAAGRSADALALAGERALPDTEAPAAVELRDAFEAGLRAAVLRSGDPDMLAAWCRSAAGTHDEPAALELLSLLAPEDPRRPVALAHLARLRRPCGG